MKTNKINLENLLFYVSYFLFMLYAFFGTIAIFREPLKQLTNVSMAIILFVLIFQLRKYKMKELIKMLLLLLVSFIFVVASKNYLFLKLSLIVLISKNISFDKKISFDVKLRVIFLLVMVAFYNLGIAEDTIAYYNDRIRHSIGFSNPNVLGLHTFILCLELLYLNKNKLSILKIILYTSIMLFSHHFSGSRTALYLYFVSLVLFYIYKLKPQFFSKGVVKKLISYSPIITTIIIAVSYLLYSNNYSIGLIIDKITSVRLLNINYFVHNYKLSLFGSDISIANKSCDTAVVYMLYAFGYLGCFIYIYGFQRLLKVLYKKNLIGIVIIIFIFMLYGISEKLWLFPDCNLLITSVGFLIYEYKGELDNGKQFD